MKRMVGIDLGSYTFNALTRQIIISGVNSLVLNQFLLITNTTDNIIIYNFADSSLGGVLISSGTSYILTLMYDTSLMNNLDSLQIFVEVENNKEESLMLLRQILIAMESKAVVDMTGFRQRINIDAIGTVVASGVATEITTTLPVSGTVTAGQLSDAVTTILTGTFVDLGGQGPTLNAPTLGTDISVLTSVVYQPVWEGPVEQRWRIVEESQMAYKKCIRNKLIFS